MTSHRRGRAAALVVLLLLAAACSAPPLAPSRPTRAVRSACHGLRAGDVRGPVPSYVGGGLARFANDTAMCRGLWLPMADQWFVPQGLALDGDTAWVSGYRWHRELGERPCRLLHVSLRTGRLLASTDRIEAEVYGDYLTFCRHGGAASLDRHGLWIVESNRLWLLDPQRIGRRDQVRRVWRLAPRVRGSVLVEGPRLGIGTWRDAGRGRLSWFGYRDVMAPGVTELVARGAAPGRAVAMRSTSAVRRVQGTTRTPGGGLWSTSSTSACGMLIGPGGRRHAFVPGAEDLELDGRGRVWVASESGSRHYQGDGRPLVPMLVQLDLRALLRGLPGRCW